MIDRAFCVTMAQYNEWMNRRLYAACAALPAAELTRDRGAFFGSIQATLDHIVYGDLSWLSRFTGVPAAPPALGVPLHADFAALRTAREALDRRLLDWSAGLADNWLDGTLTYTSQVDGLTRTVPRAVLVTHLFNHQTHHRGQVTTLLSQAGVDPGATDLPFMPPFSPTDPNPA